MGANKTSATNESEESNLEHQISFVMYMHCKFQTNQINKNCRVGWSGAAMVLGKLPVLGRPTIWMKVGQGPIALAVGAGGGCLAILLCSILSLLFHPLWETARSRLKYCFKGPLNPKQSTNQNVRRQFFSVPTVV